MKFRFTNIRQYVFISIFIALSVPIFIVRAFFDFNFLANVFSSYQIVVSPTPTPQSWTLLEKIKEGDEILEKIPVSIDKNLQIYHESRINSDGTITTKAFKENNMIIGMKILNTDTGDLEYISAPIYIETDGVRIVNPLGYEINIVGRSNGIYWNKWATQFKITSPSNRVVVRIKYPDFETEQVSKIVMNKKGKPVVVKVNQDVEKDFLYTPYSEEIDKPEIVEAGRDYELSLVAAALGELRKKNVYSRTFPNQLVANLNYLPSDFFERIPINEHIDFTEFIFNPDSVTRRTLVTLGANEDKAWGQTCNKSGACGLNQFTDTNGKGTYSTIVKLYPSAKLIKDFEAGASDHLNSTMAAILLYDYNLADLKKNFGTAILDNRSLVEEWLAAAYNGSSRYAVNSLKTALSKRISDWVDALTPKNGGLRVETLGYIAKLRFLRDNNLP